jgi:HEAT repeat protein
VAVLVAAFLVANAFGQDGTKARLKQIDKLAKDGQNAIPELARFQVDPEEKVRLEAVDALIRVGGIRSADALRTSLKDGSADVQRLAVAGIVNFYLPGYVKQGVRAKLGALGEKILRAADEPVVDRWVKVRPEDVAAIRDLLQGAANSSVKVEAANALATLRAREALPDLYPLLKSKDDAMMLAALRAIDNCGDKAAAQETVFLLRDLNDKVQQRVIRINGTIRNEGALPDLAEVFARGRSPKSKAAALEAIAMIGSPESRGLFQQNLNDKEGPNRGYAAEGLGRVGNAEDRAKLKAMFETETNTRARLGAAFALVKLGDLEQGEFSPLTTLFNALNSALWVQYGEAYLSELCREPKVREALRGKVAGATKSEKIGFARILANEGGRDDLSILEALSNDKEQEVAREGIKAARTLRARLP